MPANISINGQKIIGSGPVHPVADIDSTNFTTQSYLYYCVTNGICTVTGWIIPKAAYYSNVAVCTSLPRAKVSTYMHIPSANGESSPRLILISDGRLGFWTTSSTNGSYISIAYPVADDWYEPAS